MHRALLDAYLHLCYFYVSELMQDIDNLSDMSVLFVCDS